MPPPPALLLTTIIAITAFGPAMLTAYAATSVSATDSSRLGLTVSILPPAQRHALGVKFGVVVEALAKDADLGQIRKGDVIVAINNVEFSSLEQFNAIVDKQKPGSNVALLVKRGDAALYIAADVLKQR
jgi:serine protease Do